MRVLDYVSPDATFATAFVVKNPGQLVEELFRLLEASDPGFANKLADFESKTGVNVRMDLAQPLGGEFAVAMDGPVLPVPSWKLVLEVYDQGRFQHAVESLVNAANREMGSHGANAQPIRLASEQVGSRIFYSLRGLKAGLEAHYIYDDRLLIAAANRDLVLRALDAQSKGYSLPQSAKFAALLPQDGRTSFSGMVYHSLGSLAGIAGKFLTPEQQKQLAGLAASATPTLVLAYGGSDSIQIASRGSFFGIGTEQFFGLKPPGNRGAGPAPAKPRRPPARQTADADGLRFLQKG
jgi:hypothetical protein